MSKQLANELKQEGAIEAARNPDSQVTSAQAQKVIVDETKKAGGAAFQFDPNATPEQKAAQVAAQRQDIGHERKPNAAGIVSDKDDGKGPVYDLPEPTTAGVEPAPQKNQNGKVIANGTVTENARWARDRVGWEPRFGQGNPADDEGPTLADHQTWLESKLGDTFFGDWYYNGGVIAFACLSVHITTLLGGGLAWIFLIGAICVTYYRTSIRRTRRNFRDDVRREMAKTKIATDTESLEWINNFMLKFWPIFAPVLCESIINSVDQVLSTSTPAFLDSMRMKTFVLGTKPPRLEHVKTYPQAADDVVEMDWKFSFNPNDIADLTTRQLKNKINPKVVLEVRVGKGLVSKGLDVIVEDFAFSGTMRVKLKLQLPFPHVEKAEICFLGRPDIDYSCKPLGGDTFGFDINFIPGLESFIKEMIHGNLEYIMYDPHVFPIEIAKILAGNAVDQAIGVVQVTLHGAQGLKNLDKFSGTPDPYAKISINNRDTLGRTKTISENSNPRWNETINVIVTSLKDNLTIDVLDFNDYRKDKELGSISFPMERLEEDTELEDLQLDVMAGGRPRGVVQADIRFFPVLEGEKLPSGAVSPPPESNSGIAKFVVEQAKELDGSKSLIGALNPYAILLLNGREVQVSQKLKRTNNPIWPNASKEMLITDKKSAKLGLVIKDDRGLTGDPILGTYQIKLGDMLDLTTKGQEWYHLAGANTGRAKMMLQWKPVALKGGVAGGGYVKPIGVMRLHFQNARGLRNLETIGKSDPYVRVLLSGIEKGRTVTHQNTLDPDFDEVVYVPVHSDRERLAVEVMDEESLGKDRPMGLLELPVADFLAFEHGEYKVHDTKTPRSEQLRLSAKGTPKGVLNYTAAFYPTYNVIDPDEEKESVANGRTSLDSTRPSTRASLSRASLERPRTDRSGTIASLHKSSPSESLRRDMVKQLAQGEQEQSELSEVNGAAAPPISITTDDLSRYESGLLVYKITDVDMAHSGCFLELLIDDHLYPAYRSAKLKTRQSTLNDTGDAMIREVDFSRLTIRMREKAKDGDEEKEKVYGKVTGQTIDVLKRHLYTPWPLVLKGDDGIESRITLQLKYVPIKMELDRSESISNMGTLRCDVLDATDLPAADRNGYSDPYCKFMLNGRQVFKTQIQKKTLHPAWNEYFETNVTSRTAAQFAIEVWDWDRADNDDLLGSALINLDLLEPFQAKEIVLGLDGKSGTVRLKMVFKPDYVTRTKIGSSTFSGTFAVPGKVIGAPVKGVGKGAVFVGGNVLRAASFAGRGFRRKKLENGQIVNEPIDTPPVPSTLGAGSAPTTPQKRGLGDTDSMIVPGSGKSYASEAGVATLAVLSATGFDGDNVSVIVKQEAAHGGKQLHATKKLKSTQEGGLQWSEHGESFKTSCAADAKFVFVVKEVHTFGKDDELGEGTAQLASGDVEVPCGKGTVTVRMSFQPLPPADSGSVYAGSTAPSQSANKLHNRRTWLGGRPSMGQRSATPGE